MFRRLLTIAAACVFGIVLLAAPAQATQMSKTCKEWRGNITDTDYGICVSVWWRNDGGSTGITVYEIDVDLLGGPWEEDAFDCDAIRMWNDNDVVTWRKDGNVCDMTNSWAHVGFQPNFPAGLDMPATNTVAVSIAGWPKFNHNADPGRVVVTHNMHD